MDLGISSRFAVLPDDDEGPRPKAHLAPKPNTSVKFSSTNSQKKSQNSQQSSSKNNQVKKNQDKALRRGIDPDLQSLAFGIGRSKKYNSHNPINSSSNAKQPVNNNDKDGFDMRRQEREKEDLQFEDELEQAILLSKIEFEQSQKGNNKHRLLKISTENQEEPSPEPTPNCGKSDQRHLTDLSEDFLGDTASKLNEYSSQTIKEQLKLFECESSSRYKDWRNGPDGVIMQLQKEVAEKDNKIIRLLDKLTDALETNSTMKEELKQLKNPTANYSALEQQIDELTKEKAELADELGRLHILFEQEKSKNRALQLHCRYQNSRKDSK
ncbi:hypothetical protein CHUAL_001151 [Chamberlinius hualienensis]